MFSSSSSKAGGGKLQVYRVDDPAAPSFPADYEIVQRDVLQLTDMGANSNKFYSLELHRGAGHSFRIYTHYGRTGDVESNPSAGRRETRFAEDEARARAAYNAIKAEKEAKGYRVVQLLSSAIGSDKARAEYASASSGEAEDDGSTTLSPQVAALVRSIYKEADLALASAVSGKITPMGIQTPLGVLQMAQVLEGEEILKQIGVCLQDAGSRDELKRLCGAFFTIIPHKIGRSQSAIADAVIDTEKKFESWQEAIQLMKDMLNVQAEAQSAGSSKLSQLDMRYAALRCKIEALSPSSSEYLDVVQQIKTKEVSKPGKDLRVNVLAVYKVERPSEVECYRSALGNEHLLYHGSRYSNFVGLLSRGLLMPKVVVGRGGKRTDAGNLGNGIYFGDSPTTAAQYTQASSNGDRLFLMNRVALGSVKDYTERTVGLYEAPSGYHSVHGVRATPFQPSFFEDEEYVVFSTEQQRMQYLVQFTVADEQVAEPLPSAPSAPSASASSWSSSTSPYSSLSSASYSQSTSPYESFSSSQTVPQSSQPEQSAYSFGGPSFSSSFSSSAGSADSSFGSVRSIGGGTGTGSASNQGEMTAEQQRIKKEEDKFRERFARGDDDFSLLRESMDFLVNHSREAHRFQRERLSSEEESQVILFKDPQPAPSGQPSIAATSEMAFQAAWDKMSCEMFRGLDWSNVFAAGGSVLLALGAVPDNNSSDIDLFLYGLSESQANEKVKHIVEVVQRNSPRSDGSGVIRTKHALTIIGDYPNRHVQIVLRLYKNPAEVLMGFDIDCCAVGFDGRTAYALPRALRAINRRANLVDLSRRSLTYETRLYKYGKRGFSVIVPGADSSRVPDTLYTYALGQVKGFAKLLLLERQNNTGMKSVEASRAVPKSALAKKVQRHDPSDDAQERVLDFEVRDEEGSDYDNVLIPWGPQWSSGLILKYLLREDKQAFYGSRSKDSTSHKHVFVSGVEGVLSGKSCWCSECKSGATRSIGGDEVVSGQIQWTRTDPGRQLLTGSFHPVSDEEWFTDAYTKSAPARGNYTTSVSGNRGKAPRKALPEKKRGAMGAPVKWAVSPGKAAPAKMMTMKAPVMKKAPAMKKKAPAMKKKAPVMKKAPAKLMAAPSKKMAASSKKAKAPVKRSIKMATQKKMAATEKRPMNPDYVVPWHGGDTVPQGDAVPQGGSGYGAGADELRRIIASGAADLRAFDRDVEPLSGRSLASETISTALSATVPPQSYVSKLLLLISKMAKEGLITHDERSKLKDMVLEKHPMVLSALEVFEVDNDFDELADTFKRICRR
eukprot:TRINITY_DN33_c0_g1_i1.p1 TRINITY_DN33_c0_g1~~TRINITY_DN33_c0_g1_i1.p1  ORF type:complete len:1290 (-),score=370.68 TRINITY_DN33_c0_g1_i1:92-3961(-)